LTDRAPGELMDVDESSEQIQTDEEHTQESAGVSIWSI